MKLNEMSWQQLKALHSQRECNFAKWNEKYRLPLCANPNLGKIGIQYYLCTGVRFTNGKFPYFCPIEPRNPKQIGVMVVKLHQSSNEVI